MHKCFPFQPTFRKGVHCTKALHRPTRAVRTVQCAVRFSTLNIVITVPRHHLGSCMTDLWKGPAKFGMRGVKH